MKTKFSNELLAELAVLNQKSTEQLDYSDIPATSLVDWQGAERGKFYHPTKQQVTVRIDSDVLDWLKSDGAGYQSRLNQILRQFMLSHPKDRHA